MKQLLGKPVHRVYKWGDVIWHGDQRAPASSLVNLFTFPSDISNAAWTKTNVTISEGLADDTGALVAEGVRETTASGEHSWTRTIAKAASVLPYQVRVKFKGVTRTRLAVYAYNAAYSAGVVGYFFQSPMRLEPSSFGGSAAPTGSITAIGNGYFECVMNFQSSADAAMPLNFHLSDVDYNISYVGVAANGANVLDHRLYQTAAMSLFGEAGPPKEGHEHDLGGPADNLPPKRRAVR